MFNDILVMLKQSLNQLNRDDLVELKSLLTKLLDSERDEIIIILNNFVLLYLILTHIYGHSPSFVKSVSDSSKLLETERDEIITSTKIFMFKSYGDTLIVIDG